MLSSADTLFPYGATDDVLLEMEKPAKNDKKAWLDPHYLPLKFYPARVK
jgi:hypothetical protein